MSSYVRKMKFELEEFMATLLYQNQESIWT